MLNVSASDPVGVRLCRESKVCLGSELRACLGRTCVRLLPLFRGRGLLGHLHGLADPAGGLAWALCLLSALQGGSDRGAAPRPPACAHWTWARSAHVLGLRLSLAKARLTGAPGELAPRPHSPALLVSRKGTVLPAPPLGPAPCRGHLPPASPPGPAGHPGPLHLVHVLGTELRPGRSEVFFSC